MYNVKRITSGLLGLAIAGMATITCEKSNGPEPYSCKPEYNNLILYSKAEQGGAPIGNPIPLNAVEALIINDEAAVITVGGAPEPVGVPMASLGKIVFVP
jgi:hypothetical protein